MLVLVLVVPGKLTIRKGFAAPCPCAGTKAALSWSDFLISAAMTVRSAGKKFPCPNISTAMSSLKAAAAALTWATTLITTRGHRSTKINEVNNVEDVLPSPVSVKQSLLQECVGYPTVVSGFFFCFGKNIQALWRFLTMSDFKK